MARHSNSVTRKPGSLQGIMLLLPCTLSVMGIVLLAPVLPQMQAHFAGIPHSDYLLPMVLTMPALCITLFSPLVGVAADMIGRRRLLLIAMAVYALFGVAPLFLDGLGPILASRFCVGVTEAVIMTVSTTLIGDYFHGPQRDKWLAFQTAAASLSSILLFIVGGALGTYGWRAPFAMYASSLVLFLGLLLFTWEPEVESAIRADAAEGVAPRFPWNTMIGICAVTFVGSILFYIVQIEMSVALHEKGVTAPATIGLLTALASLGVPIGTMVFRAASRLPVGLLLALEFTIIGFGFLAMGRLADYHGFVVAVACNQLGCGMLLPTLLTWAMRQLPFQLRGRGTGIWTGTFSVGQFFSPLVVTAIGHQAGGLMPAFAIVGLIGLAAALAAFLGHAIAGRAAKAPPLGSLKSL